ncbi:MAG: class F sortase [Mycobacteriales bacterium]
MARRRPASTAIFIAVFAGCCSVAGCQSSPAATSRSASSPVPAALAASVPAAPPSAARPAAAPAPASGTPIRTYPLKLSDLPPARPGPTRVVIDRIGVQAAVTAVTNTPSGELGVPARADLVGWYQNSAQPGERGAVVLAAHVDLKGVRGVFFRLADLRKGDAVTVHGSDGVHRYRVASVTQVAKDAIGRTKVFDVAGPDELVLVTCGGQFDRVARSYRDNVVVRAMPA